MMVFMLTHDSFVLALCILRMFSHGRYTGYPVTPAHLPACSLPAPGSTEILASAIWLIRKLKSSLAVVDFRDTRSFNPMAVHHRPEAPAGVAFLLTSPVYPFLEKTHRLAKVFVQTLEIPNHAIVGVIAPKFRIERLQNAAYADAATLAAPGGEVSKALLKLLVGSAKLDDPFAFVTVSPAKLKAEEIKAVAFCFGETTDSYHTCLFRRKRQI